MGDSPASNSYNLKDVGFSSVSSKLKKGKPLNDDKDSEANLDVSDIVWFNHQIYNTVTEKVQKYNFTHIVPPGESKTFILRSIRGDLEQQENYKNSQFTMEVDQAKVRVF